MRFFRKKKWPQWIDQTRFKTPHLIFESQISDYSRKSTADVVQLLKPRSFLETYDLFAKDAKRIFEIGFFQGGMPLYFADTTKAEKIVAIDLNPVPSPIESLIPALGLPGRVSLHGGVNQADTGKLEQILLSEFGHESLDVITDDASHLYEPTKKSFETCFSYLRSGGVFLIEDWGWSHWNRGEFLKNTASFSGEKTPLSQLILEIVLAQCAQGGIFQKIEIFIGSLVAITRGELLKRGERIDLDSLVNVGKKVF